MNDSIIPFRTPSIGRIVHYQSYGSADGTYPSTMRAAVVTEVTGPSEVSLCVLNPEGVHFNKNVHFDQHDKPGTWHWPPIN